MTLPAILDPFFFSLAFLLYLSSISSPCVDFRVSSLQWLVCLTAGHHLSRPNSCLSFRLEKPPPLYIIHVNSPSLHHIHNSPLFWCPSFRDHNLRKWLFFSWHLSMSPRNVHL
ncbi:hypothetical protein B0T13DRAFT_38483 [Neurospora crassa]|nr:hypothetical protein B0T13DRAFT_38483 [Neurospora crassa]